jgi:two-component system invasion response regulator UvrY
MINVLLVDDQELVRTGIESLLNAASGISVVGVASCGEQAVLFTEQLCPDVILMDVNMPGIGGIEACRRILQMYPNIKIIALSGDSDSLIPGQLLKLGAMGFLSKNSPVDEMVEAIHKAMLGVPYLCKEVILNLAESSLENLKGNPFAQLSKRETQVVNLILQGFDIQEIVTTLNITDKSVNTYRYRLSKKLHIKNNVELTRLAAKWNYKW